MQGKGVLAFQVPLCPSASAPVLAPDRSVPASPPPTYIGVELVVVHSSGRCSVCSGWVVHSPSFAGLLAHVHLFGCACTPRACPDSRQSSTAPSFGRGSSLIAFSSAGHLREPGYHLDHSRSVYILPRPCYSPHSSSSSSSGSSPSIASLPSSFCGARCLPRAWLAARSLVEGVLLSQISGVPDVGR